MRQVAGLISTYSSDEFGICSALYELGGMIVMHDASGCNSTYTTHDEPRWYDMDSMIYISAISEMEAIMGDDDKLIHDLVETATELHPAFIAIVGAPIPYMIGTDLHAIAAITQQQTGIPAFGLEANGMHNYLSGISMALEEIVKRFCKKEIFKTEQLSVNIVGATPLDFSLNGSIDSIKAWIMEQGMTVNSCLAMGSSLEEISLAGQAHVNLVVSYGGLAAAREMEKMFHIPYVVGVPVGKIFADYLAKQLKQAIQTGENIIGYLDFKQTLSENERLIEYSKDFEGVEDIKEEQLLAIVGESVYSGSLAGAVLAETGIKTKVFCPLETESCLMGETDLLTPEEDDLLQAMQEVSGVIADPMYQPICPEKVRFYQLPHEAFSGRIYDAVNPNLINQPLNNAIGLELL